MMVRCHFLLMRKGLAMPFDLEPYCDHAYKALHSSARDLFQARKCGVYVVIPQGVRTLLIQQHGDSAIEMLNLLDGKVELAAPIG